jgi:WD40 repeat protein
MRVLLLLGIFLSVLLSARQDKESSSGQLERRVTQAMVIGGLTGTIQALALTQDSKALAVADDSSAVRLVDLKDGRLTLRYEGHSGTIRAIAFSSDGKLMATGGDDRTIRIWNVRAQREQAKSIVPSCYSLAFSPDCKVLVAGCWDTAGTERFSGIYLLSLDGRVTKHIPVKSAPITRLTFSGSNKDIAIGAEYVFLYDISTFRLKRLDGRHDRYITSLAFVNNDGLVISGSLDHRLRIWEVASGRLRFVLHEESELGCFDRILSFACMGTNGNIYTFSSDESLRAWDFRGRLVNKILVADAVRTPDASFWKAEFSKDGSVLCAVHASNKIYIIRNIILSK